MKEIKYMLYTLYVGFYTSLIWANVRWDGIQVGPNNVAIGLIILIACTAINIIFIGRYLRINWKGEK